MSGELRTERLLLRRWRESDLAPFAEINADPRVMQHLGDLLTSEQSDARAAVIEKHFADHGFGLWAVEVLGGDAFVGFIGLSHVPFEAHFTPAVEIGWRLAHHAWGRGFAREGARAVLDYAFGELGLDEVVSMTVPANVRSWGVMLAIGMIRDEAGDFEHPRLPEGHPLRQHVLYRSGRVTR